MTYQYNTAPSNIFEQLDRAQALNLDISAIALLQGRASTAGRAALGVTKMFSESKIPSISAMEMASRLSQPVDFRLQGIAYLDGNTTRLATPNEATEWELTTDEAEPVTVATFDNLDEGERMVALLHGDPVAITQLDIRDLNKALYQYHSAIRNVAQVISHPRVEAAINGSVENHEDWAQTRDFVVAVAAGLA